MASIQSRRGRNGKRLFSILFYDLRQRRHILRLGQVSAREAERLAGRIETLIAAKRAGTPQFDPEMQQWLQFGADDRIVQKLAAADLCSAREAAILGDFVTAFIESHPTWEARTIQNFQIVRKRLLEFFGATCDLREVSEGRADDWKVWLMKRYAEASWSKLIKQARQVFKSACRKGLIVRNPFVEVRAGREANGERMRFIDRATIAAVMEACPDTEWRLMVALARFGGLRIPSELLGLRWADVSWDRQRITVTKRKTRTRVISMFAELRPVLSDAFDEAPEGAEFVISRYRKRNCNLRTQLERIISRAGIEKWPRLFHNLRASGQTELTNQFPAHVVNAWLGNSEAVATKHYLQVTDDHFRVPVGGDRHGQRDSILIPSPQIDSILIPHRTRTESHGEMARIENSENSRRSLCANIGETLASCLIKLEG